MNFYLNGQKLDCPFTNVKGQLCPAVYGNFNYWFKMKPVNLGLFCFIYILKFCCLQWMMERSWMSCLKISPTDLLADTTKLCWNNLFLKHRYRVNRGDMRVCHKYIYLKNSPMSHLGREDYDTLKKLYIISRLYVHSVSSQFI